MNFFTKLSAIATAFVLVASACSGDSPDPVVEPAPVVTAEPTDESTPTSAPVDDAAEPTSDVSRTPEPESVEVEPTADPSVEPEIEPTSTIEDRLVIEPSPEPTEVGLPDFGTPEPTAVSTPEVEPTPESTPAVEPTPASTPVVEPTPESTPEVEPTPVVETTSEPVRLMSVEEIVAAAPHLETFAQPYAPEKGDNEAALEACMELGDAVQVDPAGVSLALCSVVVRGAAWAVNYALADPECAHQQGREWVQQPYDGSRPVGWADVCFAGIDPGPSNPWMGRCRTAAALVTPVATSPDQFHDGVLWHLCGQHEPTAEQRERFGRCADLIVLYASMTLFTQLARAPENQWPVTFEVTVSPDDMIFGC